jgi:DNA polymerase III subunit beta
MKIRLEQSAFTEIVSWVQRAVGSRSQLPALSGIRFEAAKGAVTLSGTDLDLSTRASVECSVDEPGSVLLHGRLLGDIAKNLPEGAVSIMTTDNQAVISSGSVSFTLRTLPIDDFPEQRDIGGASGTITVAELASAVNQVARAASTDEARPVLTGVLVESGPDKATLVATDSYRLAVREIEWTGPKEEIRRVIPAKAFTEAARMGSEGTANITIGETQAAFEIGGRLLTSRTLEGEFPKWNGLIPKELPNRLTVDKEVFIDAVRRVGLLAQAGSSVKIELIESGAKLTAGSQDIGDAVEQIDGKFEGEPLTVAFNPQFLIDGVAAINSNEIVLCLLDGMKPAVVRAPEEDGFIYLVMPVRS